MSARLASGVTVFAVYGVLAGVAFANGCSSSSGNRGASTESNTSTSTSSSTSTSGSTSTSTSTSTGSSSSSGAEAATEAPSCSGQPPACSFPTAPPDGGIIYNGGTSSGFCPSTYTFDGISQSWFGYSDPAAPKVTSGGVQNGCNGAGSCAYSVSGSGYAQYAGIGVTLGNNAPENVSQYDGIYAWVMGSTTDTRAGGVGTDYNTAVANVVHIKFVTGADGGDELDNDDFGFYCPIQPTCWTLCQSSFAALTQDSGYGIDDASAFDTQNVIKIQFEASAYTPPDSGTPSMTVNFTVDNVGFYAGSSPGGQDSGGGSDSGGSDASGQ